MTPVTVYIFRHGETDWNVARRFQGHTNIPLNEKGRRQAQRLGQAFAKLNIQVVLSSDLSRAHETAQIAFENLNTPIFTSTSLREANLGEPEGQLRDDIIKIYGLDSWHKWCSVKPEDMDFSYPKGETKRAQLTRVLDFVHDYFDKNIHIYNLAVSTHGGTLRRLLHHCEGAPSEPIPIPNCSLYKLEFCRIQKKWRYLGTIASVGDNEKLFT